MLSYTVYTGISNNSGTRIQYHASLAGGNTVLATSVNTDKISCCPAAPDRRSYGRIVVSSAPTGAQKTNQLTFSMLMLTCQKPYNLHMFY